MNGLGTHLCFCRENFAGEFCQIPIDDIVDSCDNTNTNNRTCSSFSVVRMDNGDRVNTPLSSVEYCHSIRAYCPDGSCSYCQCEFRLTYRHDLQRCDDYYNRKSNNMLYFQDNSVAIIAIAIYSYSYI